SRSQLHRWYVTQRASEFRQQSEIKSSRATTELLISGNNIFRDEGRELESRREKRKFVARRKDLLPGFSATAEKREEARRMASGRTRLGMASEKISSRGE
ncbi:hypothetical protein K0M31_004581, partial [Melipona bicolor]